MRIAHVTSHYFPDPGGVARVVGELASRMAAAGHEVEVLSHASGGAPSGTSRQRAVLLRRFRVPLPSEDLAVSPGLLAHLVRRRHAFDVIHAHNFHASPAPIAALAGARPLVLSPYYHGVGHIRTAGLAYSLYGPFARQLLRICSQVTCCSTAEATALRRDFPGMRAPVTVVPPGVDADSFSGAPPFERSGKVVLAAGGMAPYKQVDRVALAIELLSEDHELVILGDGAGRRRIERLVADRGLVGRVHCLGHVPERELVRWLSTAAVVVSMSRLESFGLTLYEGLAAGATIVASDIPAHRELTDSQPPGTVHLLPVEASADQIAAAILHSSRTRTNRPPRLGSWDDAVEKLLRTYARVAEQRDQC